MEKYEGKYQGNEKYQVTSVLIRFGKTGCTAIIIIADVDNLKCNQGRAYCRYEQERSPKQKKPSYTIFHCR